MPTLAKLVRSSSLVSILGVAGAALLSGCSTFATTPPTLPPQVAALPPGPGEANPLPSKPPVTIEYHNEDGPLQKQAVVWQQSMTAQSVLKAARADRKFRRFKVQIFRNASADNVVRMDVHYDRGQKRVDAAYDYALHPGDRLVITQDTSNLMDDMLGRFTGPLSALSH